ncbi:hypothetical protein PULV_a0701 [Pseudoalteromonas ulvae UL12]|uniref:S9 family peptidase n=1 Tax=Pseudoalteromonas ulvae TaxID=107327 RepID=UPI00186B65B8|nr:prolyl oligopeptidase family serine peptidase [Pseudoalteromonas ulvae]MBE0363076.1 hypothetical protein [Pseudoalteromonas ulvae UL12]
MKSMVSLITAAVITSLSAPALAQKALSFTDVFDFKKSKHLTLSENGEFAALSATPYRGDPTGHLYQLSNNTLIAQIPNGTKPQFSKNGLWVGFTVKPDLLTTETASAKEKKKLKNQLVLINTQTQQQLRFDDVADFTLNDNGQWLAFRQDSPKDEKQTNQDDNKDTPVLSIDEEQTAAAQIKPDKKDKSFALKLVNLSTQTTHTVDSVFSYAFSPRNNGILVSQVSKNGDTNQIAYFELDEHLTQHALMTEPGIVATQIKWHPTTNHVAFYAGNYVNDDLRRRQHLLYLWQQETNQLTTIEQTENWFSGKTASLEWSEHGERLYFENRPNLAQKQPEKEYKTAEDLRDFDTIRAQKGLKVWHHKDEQIKTREQIQWDKENKNRHYQAVYHLNGQKVVQLSSPSLEDLSLHTEKEYLLAASSTPYLNKVMFDGFYADYYAIDTKNGQQRAIVKQSRTRPTLAPNGQFAAYFQDGDIQLKQLAKQSASNLTQNIDATFADDQHDYPTPVPGYGFAGWSADSSQVLAYGKYDIWAFDVKTQQGQRLTQGYKSNTLYRVINLDNNQVGFNPEQTLVLSAHNLNTKETAIATLNLQDKTLKTVLSGKKRFDVIKKAKSADTLLFTQQTYHQFPDLWQTDLTFNSSKKLTDLNPQQAQFAWGKTPELVQYKGFDGEDLQGVLIKPAGYKKGDKVPVVIYFYRYMSQRMYDFPAMELNHRPNFPMFTSNGYAVFLPDIRFELGHPGKSSTQTMINAAQKLIDIGVAHPDKIGLQGHSWAGYQSAFMITQTDMFKAVVSGAPVSNMTSAYSGIRLKSGLARQFQYETGQSRIGKSLFEGLDLYIENSPVFFADKVNTPILMMFGDKDDAVPWHEGVQYYLALRRAQKDVIFLQYEGEPHHLKQFPNQVDFSIRMMEYFDHHLKGKPAPTWMQQGEAYTPE